LFETIGFKTIFAGKGQPEIKGPSASEEKTKANASAVPPVTDVTKRSSADGETDDQKGQQQQEADLPNDKIFATFLKDKKILISPAYSAIIEHLLAYVQEHGKESLNALNSDYIFRGILPAEREKFVNYFREQKHMNTFDLAEPKYMKIYYDFLAILRVCLSKMNEK